MGTIRVEAVPVQSYFLGLFRFDHLQLVYQDETDPIDSQDYWFVLEGIQDGPLLSATLGVSGEDGSTSLAVANGASRDELTDLIGTPEQRGSRIVVSGPNAASLWSTMTSYAGDIEDQEFPYIPASLPFSASPTINSTSLVASALNSIGIDLNNLLPFTMRFSPGPETILGTSGADDMSTTSNFTTIATGAGDDTLHGATNGFWLEKLFGGAGDDIITWSFGQNIHHGGQPRTAYINDGLDTIDYTGVGAVHIEITAHAVEHKVADFISTFSGGSDQWFSIEQIFWDDASDVVTTGPGVNFLERPLGLDFKGQGGGRGDQLSFSDTSTPLLINVADGGFMSVQTQSNAGLDAGYWLRSAEWITASAGDDRIYTGPDLLGVEGFDGDDLIDARLATAFSGQSPAGYDIEIDGGSGDDTIVSSEGRTLARGGDGADRFILSAMTSGSGRVEFVIEDADTSDQLYVPYDFFKQARGGYEGSALFQLSGGVFKITDAFTPSFFFWGPPDNNEAQGNIEFVGSVAYATEGGDLIITILQGHVETETIDYGPGEPPGPTITSVVTDDETETIIRVVSWSEGVLGITFPITYDDQEFANAGSLGDYPGFQSAVNDATSGNKFIAALEARPDGHLPLELAANTVAARGLAPPDTDGTDGDDIIVVSTGGPYQISGFAGNDILTGSDGGDLLDGGLGADTMTGGRGNDVYIVDNAGDQIFETSGGGFDTIFSSIDYTLGDHLEHLTLTGLAVQATGNALRNTLVGNDRNNVLNGGEGDDTLAGNGGDDTLIGGEGGDGYVYEFGDGRDTIIEAGTGANDHDVIVLAGDLKPTDITFIRNPDQPNNLILQFADGGGLTIKDYFAGSAPPIEGITFTSGAPAWSSADIQAAAAAAIVTRNTAPIARDDYFGYSRGSTVAIPIAALLDNDSDANGDTLSITSLSNIVGGTAILDGNGNVVVARATGHSGPVTFDYAISDGHGGTSRATFEIALSQQAPPPNEAPRLVSVSIANVREDKAATGKIVATDADGDALTYGVKAGSGPAKGNVSITADGTFVYTPNANANGSERFTVTVSDGRNAPVEQQLSFNIAAVNDKPVAVNDSGFSVKAGQTLKIASSALLHNDSDVDGNALMITAVSSAKGGTVSRNADGSVSFKANAAGDASFKYTISDGEGGTSTAIVSINVLSATPKTITGTNRADVLKGTSADEIFVGKAGNDTFVFKGITGDDQIKDFQTGIWFLCQGDVLDLRGKGFTSYGDLWDSIHKSGHDTVINFDDGGSVRLKDVHPLLLNPDNFKIF